MKSVWGWAVIGAMLTLTGCFDMPSVAPLYTKQTAVAEPAFAGYWLAKEGKESMYVRKDNDNGYKATYIDDKGEVTPWDVHLVRMGDVLVADVMASKEDAGIPAHHFMALAVSGTALKAYFVDSDELRKKAAQDGLAYVSEDKKTVLTGTTAALAAFVKKNLASEMKKNPDLEFSRVR
jgi:hypothetical protein